MKFGGMVSALALRTARKRSETRFGKLLAASNEQRQPWYRRETSGVPNIAWGLLALGTAAAVVHYFMYPPF
jgi:hypothetical protein